MTLPEIIAALADGLTVCWKNTSYQVKGKPDNLLVCCTWNNHCIGLNADHLPEDFFMLPKPVPTAFPVAVPNHLLDFLRLKRDHQI